MKTRSRPGASPGRRWTVCTRITAVLFSLVLLSSVAGSISTLYASGQDAAQRTDRVAETISDGSDVAAQSTTETQPTEESLPTEETLPTEEILPTDETQPTTETQNLQPAEEPGSVTVSLLECPDTQSLPTSDGNGPQGCVPASVPGSFSLDGALNGSLPGSTDPGSGSAVGWSGLTPETLSLTMTAPAASTFDVWCQGNTTYGNTKPYASYFLAASPSTSFDLLAGEQVDCFFFVPATPTQTDSWSLTLYKWQCPDGTEYNGAADDYSAECATEQPGVPFTLTDNGGTRSFQSDTNGHQEDNVVPAAGGVTLQESIPDGYGDPVVFCQRLNDASSTTFPASGGMITIDASFFTEDVQCFWYNVPQTQINITIYKWQCPDDTTYGGQPDYYSAECDQEMLGVPFALTDANGDRSFTSEANGHQEDDIVPDPANGVVITETIPDGYGDPVVYCQRLNDTAPTAFPATGGIVTLPATFFTEDIQCFWYNLPHTPINITIYKWKCPNGTMYGLQADDYSAACDQEMLGIPFTLTDGNGDRSFQSEANGHQEDDIVPDPATGVVITESVPSGYGQPVVFCQRLNDNAPTLVAVANGAITLDASFFTEDIQCFWYNLPITPGEIIIYKWQCPETFDVTTASETDFQNSCTQVLAGVTFTLTDSAGPRDLTTDNGGFVEWDDVAPGAATVTEQIPSGYSGQPYVFCSATKDQQPYDPTYGVVNGTLTVNYDQPGIIVICHWFNIKRGPADITIYKWLCPEGYDYQAYGANPANDCKQAQNGVTFTLDGPNGYHSQTDTGDAINGAVKFGGLEPGGYVVNEMPPANIGYAFVTTCYGLSSGSVMPYPLNVGYTLNLTVYSGDHIECHWYNVPTPQTGSLTVGKKVCTTPTYVSDVDCQIFEGGQQFTIQVWNGTAWQDVTNGTTNAAGQLVVNGLPGGTYRAVEPGKTACKTTTTNPDQNGNTKVDAGTMQTMTVYNCSSSTTTSKPKPPTPTKFPNTGVPPVQRPEQRMPTMGAIGAVGAIASMMVSRRRFLALGSGAVGLSTVGLAMALEGDGTPPIEGTPGGTPEIPENVNCLASATPSAATAEAGNAAGTPAACVRGAVPAHIVIEAIGVDADIEILEIVDGAMQQPTAERDVAWYKETARIGEIGNMLLAGHLNWWGFPEAVFFNLHLLKKGDLVELTGEGDVKRAYVVQWTTDFPSDQEPPTEAVAPTDREAITMITCGGEWVTDRAEYDHRTVVRAVPQEAT